MADQPTHADDTIYTCPRCKAEMPYWQQAHHDDPAYGNCPETPTSYSYTLTDFAADLRAITEPILEPGNPARTKE